MQPAARGARLDGNTRRAAVASYAKVETGPRNPGFGADRFGLSDLGAVSWNDGFPVLVEEAVARREGRLTAFGALCVETGAHTGRSAQDKYLVRTSGTQDQVWWDNNKAMSPEAFDRLHADMLAHAKGKDLFAQDLYGGADPEHRVKVRVFCEYAWHALFIRHHADPPGGGRSGGFRARDHHHRPAQLPRRSGAARVPLADRDRLRPGARHRSHRRARPTAAR